METMITCYVCEQECDAPEGVDICDMMPYLIGEDKYTTCCNCYQCPTNANNKEYRKRWDKHFKKVDNGYRPVDKKMNAMIERLYESTS